MSPKIFHYMDEKTQAGYGPWVRFSDYEALEASFIERIEREDQESARLRAENERLTGVLKETTDALLSANFKVSNAAARALAAEARAEKAGEWLAIVERIANFHPTWIAVARRDIIETALASLPKDRAAQRPPADEQSGETSPGSDTVKEMARGDIADRWPNGCHSPNSCSRHRACMYINCRHEKRSISAEIDACLARETARGGWRCLTWRD